MAVDLAELVAAGHTALVTQECQGAVVGQQAALPVLEDLARQVTDRARVAPAAEVPVA